MGLTADVRFPVGARAQHQSTMGIGNCFSEVKRHWDEVDKPPSSSAKALKGGAILSFPNSLHGLT
jgi:hypothetical protein